MNSVASSVITGITDTTARTILIVDDHIDNLRLLLAHLNEAGYRTLTARDGASALERARYHTPDLILLDISMPMMDGLETCRQLKADQKLCDIPVIFTTGRSDTADKLRGFAAGGADYITKPFQPAEVLARVRVHLALREAQGQVSRQNAQLQREVHERARVEVALRAAHAELERRVAERTHELAEANARLSEEVGERRQIERAMEQQVGELSLLHAVATAIGESCGEQQLVAEVVRIFGAARPLEGLGVLLLSPEGYELRRQEPCHGPPALWPPEAALAGRGPIGRVVASGRSSLVEAHGEGAPPLPPGVCATLCVPLRVGGQVIGVMALNSGRPGSFSHREQRLIETVAGQLSTALEKIQLLSETVRHLKRAEALHAIDQAITSHLGLRHTFDVVAEHLLGQLHVEAAAVWVRDEHDELRCVSRSGPAPLDDTSLARLVVGGGAPLLYPGPSHAAPPPGLAPYAAYIGLPIISAGRTCGVVELYGARAIVLSQERATFLETIAAQVAVAIDNHTMFQALQRSHLELSAAYDATLEGWARALELRDHETEGHSRQVTDLTIKLAQAVGVPSRQIVHIRRGALLHDIGKLGIADAILLNTGPLDEAGWAMMRRHPDYAVAMLEPISYLQPALEIPKYHHERWDGSGYPFGLAEEQIPLAARIFAIVDVWDALTSDRPYRKAWTSERALQHIQSEAGKSFDPELVAVFLRLVQQGLAAPADNERTDLFHGRII